jgi:peptidoglycan/xylan/chitin deacetylase (PgdA/CDA1 family)
MAALKEAGYNTVTLDQLEAYVHQGVSLPEKPVMITFDDGYRSNYEYAYPVLKKYGMNAVIFAVGSSVGRSKYKDTDYDTIPHFSAEEGREMIDSGVISIQSHTYDMHQWPDYESGTARESVLRLEGESEEDYIKLFSDDCTKIREVIEQEMGGNVHAISYPHGDHDNLSDVLLAEEGYDISFTVDSGVNVLVKGMEQSLLRMKRNNVDNDTTDEQLLEMIDDKTYS